MAMCGCAASLLVDSTSVVDEFKMRVRYGCENMEASKPLSPSRCAVSASCAERFSSVSRGGSRPRKHF